MRISYSLLETYKQCPQKYKFQEIDRIKSAKSKEALFGSAVHETLKFMFSRDPLFPTLEEVLAHFRERFMESKHITEEEKNRYREVGEKILRNFYMKNPPWNFNVVDLESRFEVVLDDQLYKSKHVLVGKIDRVDKLEDGSFEVIDYKTSRRLPSQDAVDHNLQLAVYQLGLQKRWPHLEPESIVLSLYYLRSGDKFTTKRSRESLEGTEKQLLAQLHGIEKKTEEKDFPPMPSALCDWCSYKQICPAWRHLYKKPEEKVEIEKVMQEYFTLKTETDEKEKRMAELMATIRAYLESDGLDRIFGAYGTISRTAQERTSWDIDKVKEILSGHPLWQELLIIDQKKVKLVMARLPYELSERLKNEARVVKKFSMIKVSNKKESPPPL